MRLSVSNRDLGSVVREALAKGGAERLEEEVSFVVESLCGDAEKWEDRLQLVLSRLSAGESPYAVIGRYPIPNTQHWISVPVDVMPPGCDTADVIGAIRSVVRDRNAAQIADVGCGCGVLGLSALISAAKAHGYFFDIDERACKATNDNILRLGLANRCTVECVDAELGLRGLELDLIVTNLPFVPTKDVPKLGARFRDYAPRRAVDGGHDGLDVLQRLEGALHSALRPSGAMILQFGNGQREVMLSKLGSRWVECWDIGLDHPNFIVVARAM